LTAKAVESSTVASLDRRCFQMAGIGRPECPAGATTGANLSGELVRTVRRGQIRPTASARRRPLRISATTGTGTSLEPSRNEPQLRACLGEGERGGAANAGRRLRHECGFPVGL